MLVVMRHKQDASSSGERREIIVRTESSSVQIFSKLDVYTLCARHGSRQQGHSGNYGRRKAPALKMTQVAKCRETCPFPPSF